ncbi:tyrosine-type recombinase/integrase [Actinoplanes sp. URMC 104]|uniref:tyrosine-type recombinase/integrase n=1 Tax=Actinoplanes sp. URMC 104 TaxID=3423409 RepID=UPI003F1B8CA0
MATLEHRGESVRVNWRLGGARDGSRQSCTFRGPAGARVELARAAKQLVEARGHNITRAECYAAILGEDPDVAEVVPTFRAWVEMWLREREQARDIEAQTIRNYRWELTTRVVPRLGHLPLSDIDAAAVKDWAGWVSGRRTTRGNRNRNTLANQLLSPTTIGKTYRILHACLGGAVPKWIPVNPAARPDGARKNPHGLPKRERFEGMFLHPHEIELILSHCDPRITDLVKVALATGMRLGELLALQAQHVTSAGAQTVVQVRQTLKDDGTIGAPKSAAGVRAIPVDDATAVLLRQRLAGRRPRDWVFPNPWGGLWTEDNFRKGYWWPAVAAAQRCPEHPPPLPAYQGRGRRPTWKAHDVSTCACPTRLHRRPRPHDLRHTHASALINAKLSPKKVQVRLGHANFTTTMTVYAHLWDLGEAAELEAVAQLLLPPATARGPGG